MKDESMTDAQLREFLLGGLDDDTRERIESLFLTDPQIKESVLVTEQDLIEDYLENGLSKEDKERFVSRYAQTDDQRRKLRIAESIKHWAVTEHRVNQVTPVTVSIWSRLRTQLGLKPAVVVPIAVMIAIAIVLAIVWLNSQRERQKHLAIEQELAQLNSPASLREDRPQMISQELKPVTVRSGSQTEVSPHSDTRIVELSLPWIQKERYPTYEVEVHRLHDEDSFTIRNLQLESNDRSVIRIRLPIHILRPGQYQIHLRGTANNGTQSSSEEYSFTING